MNTTSLGLKKPEGIDPVDIQDFNDNADIIDEELKKRPEKTGSASDMTTAFSPATSRTNLTSGESLKTSLGKIMRWFSDLKSAAFSAVANNLTTTAAGSVLDARQGKVLSDKVDAITGIPAVCNTIADWNSAVKNGWYMSPDALNAPTAGWYFGIVIAHNASYVIQTVYQFTAHTDMKDIPCYQRICNNGTWSAWRKVSLNGYYVDDNGFLTHYNGGGKFAFDGNVYVKTGNYDGWLSNYLDMFTRSVDGYVNPATVFSYLKSNGSIDVLGSVFASSVQANFIVPNGNLLSLLGSNDSAIWNNARIEVNSADEANLSQIRFVTGDTKITYAYRDFFPSLPIGLGNSTYKWDCLYAYVGTILTSDRKKKKDICRLDEELIKQFIMGLVPSSYKMIEGTSGRTHYGFIAQDIEELMESLEMSSMDFAGFIKSPRTEIEEVRDSDGNVVDTRQKVIDGEYEYALRYDEFIAPAIQMIQMQQNEIDSLSEKNKKLQERMDKLEARFNELEKLL